MESNLVWALLILNVLQYLWWAKQVQTLVDKVMSKTYAEYVQSTKKAKDVPKSIKVPSIDQDEDVAGHLNKMFGA